MYFANLYDWNTTEDVNLYKSISWTWIDEHKSVRFANYAAQSMESLLRLVETRLHRRDANIYAALGTQRMAQMEKITSDGYPRAQRVASNMVSYKSIALDIDVGKTGAYATTQDAFAALDGICATIGMPPPTMEVYSGSGGLHIYWCLKEAIPAANWKPLAMALRDAMHKNGLLFDPQCTVNPAGILRVPNTFHWKNDPPGKVRLYREARHTFTQYDYQTMVSVLSPYMGQPGTNKAAHAAQTATSGINRNFTAGVDESSPPVSIDDLAGPCGAIRDILDRGGNGDAEPLWNLGLYAASFTSDPHDAAHRMSDQDKRYSKDGTEKKLIEKINARAANPAAGWPTCDSFSKLHPACAVCPLFPYNKSPFHFAPRAKPLNQTATLESAPATIGTDKLMPPNYWRGAKNNNVYTVITQKDGNSFTQRVVPYPILDAGLDPTDGSINYQVIISGKVEWRNVSVGNNQHKTAAAQAFAKGNGVYTEAKTHDYVRDFLLAWTTHLQNIHKYVRQSGYGWGDNRTTFAFDDKIYHETKVETVFRGKAHDPNFIAKGKAQPWQDAMSLIYGNAPLECIVASAFAAPLVELMSTTSVVVSAFSRGSGVGKTTAMMLAQAVWGHPRGGMSTLNDTYNSMMKKITDLKSLPLYWDELRTKGQLEKVIDIIFSVTQGKGKARLTKDIVQAEASPFTTMFIVASNYGLSDTVYNQTESTDAGGLRLFEIEPKPLVSPVTGYAASQLMIKVQDNYGVVGSQYAGWLAQNRKTVEQFIQAISDGLNDEHKFEARERFWAITMTTLLAGATLANACEFTRFDIQALRDFLGDALRRQRAMMHTQDYSTLATPDDANSILQELRIEQHNRSMIITKTIPYASAGRPVQMPTEDTDLSKVSNVWLQYGLEDGRMRMLVRPFNDWLRKRGLNPGQFKEMLRSIYVVSQSKQSIGVGVIGIDAVSHGRAECYDLTPINPPSRAPSHGSFSPS